MGEVLKVVGLQMHSVLERIWLELGGGLPETQLVAALLMPLGFFQIASNMPVENELAKLCGPAEPPPLGVLQCPREVPNQSTECK